MSAFSFHQVLIYSNLGGAVRFARNERVRVIDPATGLTAPGLEVAGAPVTFVTSDNNGIVDFTAAIPTVRFTVNAGTSRELSWDYTSQEAIGAGTGDTAGILTQIDELRGLIAAVPTTGGMPFPKAWRLVADRQQLVTGYVTEETYIPRAGVITESPRIKLNDYSSEPTIVDVLLRPPGQPAASIYTGPLPTVPAGATEVLPGSLPIPTTQAVPAGSHLSLRCVKAPPLASGSSTSAALAGAGTSYSRPDAANPTPAAPGTHDLGMPAGGTLNHTAVGVLTTAGGGASHAMPAGWSLLTAIVCTDLTEGNVVKATVWAAPWTPTLTAVASTTGSPAAGFVRLFTGTDIDRIDVFPSTSFRPNSPTKDYTLPPATATKDYDVLLFAAAAWYPSGVTGWNQTLTGGPTTPAIAQEANKATNRTGSNVGLAVATRPGTVVTGATIPGVKTTLADGVGSTANVSFIGATIGISRAPGSHGPTEMLVELSIDGA